MDNEKYTLIPHNKLLSGLGISPEQAEALRESVMSNPLNMAEQVFRPTNAMPQIEKESTAVYKLQQIVEQGDQQIKELKSANLQLQIQNDLLGQELDETRKQSSILEQKFESEKLEKDKAITESRKNKKWGVAGKILSAIIAFIAFSITILVSH